jgi:hypothetical protein
VLGFDQREEIDRPPFSGTVIARFAGLDFKLDGAAALCARFVRAARDHAPSSPLEHRDAAAPKFAVDCHVEALGASRTEAMAEEVPALPRAGIAWSWGGDDGHVATRFGHARVALAAGRFAARIRVQDEALGPRFLLSGLSALVLHRLGGGILHSASVELDAGVVAFVGPSGAGKSTACRHVDGCALFSTDTLAVVPRPSGGARRMWFAHPLPGGTRPVPDMTSAARRWLPLRAVLRVHRSMFETSASDASPAAAVALLRESAFQLGSGVRGEHELLARLDELSQAVRIGRLQLCLGASLKPILDRWLLDQRVENCR